MVNPTPEQIAKLPKWAQEYITQLERQRDAAVKVMRDSANGTTRSPFYFEDHACVKPGGPEVVRHYIQAPWLKFDYGGLHVDFLLREHGEDKVLDIQYGTSSRMVGNKVVFEPRSYQQFYLYCPQKENSK